MVGQSPVFMSIERAFLSYFDSYAYSVVPPFALNNSDAKGAFVRSVNTTPAYEYFKNGALYFKAPRVVLSQPVVRPEDFLELEDNVLLYPESRRIRAGYRCGVFNMCAIWKINEGERLGHPEIGKSGLADFYVALSRMLTFFSEKLHMDPGRMWFSLWPGGKVANGAGYIPKDLDSRVFLREVWGARDEQIAWDEENIWPDSANKGVLDPNRTGLVGQRVEMYYRVRNLESRAFPRSAADVDTFGFMELMSAIPIPWIHDKVNGTFDRVPPEKLTFEMAFGLERACLCVEGVHRVHDIEFFRELRERLNEHSAMNANRRLFPSGDAGDALFSKLVDRMRFTILAAAQGNQFSDGRKGVSFKRAAQGMFELLRGMGLNNIQACRLIDVGCEYLAAFYPEIRLVHASPLADLFRQSLDPAFVLGKRYVLLDDGTPSEEDVIQCANRSHRRRDRIIPELPIV